MNVLGIFRGLPGLGRVVGGMALLELLNREFNATCFVYTYSQGIKYASKFSYSIYTVDNIEDVMTLGINPISYSSEKIMKLIHEKSINLIIIEGEPLITFHIKINCPQIIVISLVNPLDIENTANPLSTHNFLNCLLSKADFTISHGLVKVNNNPYYKNLYQINTLLANSFIESKQGILNQTKHNSISVILGGGMEGGNGFTESNLNFLNTVIDLARLQKNFDFNVYGVSELILKHYKTKIPSNVNFQFEVINHDELYKHEFVIARSGRNTTSELLFLNKPAILLTVENEHRKHEQLSNITSAMNKSFVKYRHYKIGDDLHHQILREIQEINSSQEDFQWFPGNYEIKEILKQILY
ncbi:MAG TPA: hypothetical protein DCS17_10735 [Flavobacterium sp.]|jgi:Glycosyl transferases, related to UDP-glucuronosyltransferase|nr:hypothetical protein [Flavobacterium sp.]